MLISVIIPVYNAENFLHKAIDSLIHQTNANIEIILVNDGSTDTSGQICDKYSLNYVNIKVLHKKNGGAPSARNAGMKLASGTHISFLDADDFYDDDAYENLYMVIEKYDPDCIDFGWKYINDDGEITSNLHKLPKKEILDKDYIYGNILPPLLNLVERNDKFIYDFAVNKIYKKELIDIYNIYFDENRRTWEDRTFVVEYLRYCKTFYSIGKCFYNYVSVPNSLSRRYDMQFFDIILSNFKFYAEEFGDIYDFECEYTINYFCHAIENMIMRSLKEHENQDKIKENIKKIFNNEKVIYWYKNRIPKNDFEMKVSNCIVNSDGEKALKLYMKYLKREERIEFLGNTKRLINKLRRKFLNEI